MGLTLFPHLFLRIFEILSKNCIYQTGNNIIPEVFISSYALSFFQQQFSLTKIPFIIS